MNVWKTYRQEFGCFMYQLWFDRIMAMSLWSHFFWPTLYMQCNQMLNSRIFSCCCVTLCYACLWFSCCWLISAHKSYFLSLPPILWAAGGIVFDLSVHLCVYAGGGILRPACRRLLVILYCIRSNAVQVTTLLLAMFVCNKYVYLWLVTLKRVCVWCDFNISVFRFL